MPASNRKRSAPPLPDGESVHGPGGVPAADAGHVPEGVQAPEAGRPPGAEAGEGAHAEHQAQQANAQRVAFAAGAAGLHGAVGAASGDIAAAFYARCTVCRMRNASYGVRGGAQALRCGDCRLSTDVSMKHKMCDVCGERRARFASSNTRTAQRCGVCRLASDISVTHKTCETCGKRRAVVLPNGGRNALGETPNGPKPVPVRCRQCRLPGDACVGETLCVTCLERRPAYANIGERAKRCRQCKLETDVDVTHRVCEVCNRVRAGFAPPGGEGGPIRCGMCKLPDDVSIKLARKCARRLNSTSSPNTSGRDGTNTSSQSLSAGATIMSGMSVQQQLHSVGGPPPLPGLQGDYATAAAAAHAVAQAAHAHAARAAAASTTARPPNMILLEQLAASYSAMAYANPNSTIALSGIHQSPFHSAPTYHATTSAEGSVHGGHSFQSLRAGAPAFNALMKAAMEQSSQQQAMEHARLAATGMPISMRGGNPMFEGSVHTIEGSPLSTIMAAQQMNGALNGMPYGVVPSTIASLISPHSPVTQGALSAAAVGAAAANIELPVSVPPLVITQPVLPHPPAR